MKPGASEKSENAAMSGFAKFGPLDQLDWLIILLAVLAGTLAKQHHFLDLPAWFLDWAFPFLLIIAGYTARRKITDIRNRARRRSTRGE
jgi:hypothetical protein